MNFDWTKVFIAFISLLATIITTFVIPVLKQKKYEKIMNALKCAAEAGVLFAQQWYKTDDGETKKEHALKYAQEQLAMRGINIDVDIVSNQIEAELIRLKNTLFNNDKLY